MSNHVQQKQKVNTKKANKIKKKLKQKCKPTKKTAPFNCINYFELYHRPIVTSINQPRVINNLNIVNCEQSSKVLLLNDVL